MSEPSHGGASGPRAMVGPFTRPLSRDPAVWFTLVFVTATTLVSAARAWSESSALGNALVIGVLTFASSSIVTVFLVAIVVGIPRGWRLGRDARPPGRP